MMLGAHLTPRARDSIECADVVFVLASDGLVERWVQQARPDARSLQPCYSEGTPRRLAYEQMVGLLLSEVRAGRHVCAAFYGHPGVFAQVGHDAIEQARREGFEAGMQPGISAEDCLYADLDIDPGRFGCQHYEATQFLCCTRQVDTAAYLVLWQVAVVGDTTFARYASSRAHRRLLVERLAQFYPAGHQVVIYEAPTIATSRPRMDRIRFEDLVDADLHMHSTLVVGPAHELVTDQQMLSRLDRLEAEEAARRTARPGLVLVPR